MAPWLLHLILHQVMEEVWPSRQAIAREGCVDNHTCRNEGKGMKEEMETHFQQHTSSNLDHAVLMNLLVFDRDVTN